MLVSTFELVFAPITPTPGAVARRILQGYFLTLTNLEATAYDYQLDFSITTPTPPDASRLLTSGVLLVDNGIATSTAIPGTTNNIIALNAGSGAAAATYTSDLFTIPAKQTALAVLLPGDPGSSTFFTDLTKRAEVRGYVNIRLPALLTYTTGPFGFFRYVAQSSAPVKVLVNPETRGAFVPAAGGSPSGFDFDNVQSALAIASGQAENAITPDPSRPFILQSTAPNFERLVTLVDPRLAQADDDVRTATLLALLSQVGTDDDTLRALDGLLEQAGIPLSLNARKAS